MCRASRTTGFVLLAQPNRSSGLARRLGQLRFFSLFSSFCALGTFVFFFRFGPVARASPPSRKKTPGTLSEPRAMAGFHQIRSHGMSCCRYARRRRTESSASPSLTLSSVSLGPPPCGATATNLGGRKQFSRGTVSNRRVRTGRRRGPGRRVPPPPGMVRGVRPSLSVEQRGLALLLEAGPEGEFCRGWRGVVQARNKP